VSIYGATPIEREMTARGELRICDDCGFQGTSADSSDDEDYCSACGETIPHSREDKCSACGACNCLMLACPKCGGRFSLDYERMIPPAEAAYAFRQFIRAERAICATPPTTAAGSHPISEQE
jgi:hypothetical protein